MQKCIESVNTYFKHIDIFGVNLNFKISKRDSYKTTTGSVFSLIIVTYLIFKIVTSLRDIILKENLEVNIQELPESISEIELKDFFVGICNYGAWQRGDPTFLDRHSFLYYNTFIENDYNPHFNNSRSLSSEDCETVRDLDPHKTCRCLKFSKEKYENITQRMDYFLNSTNIGIGLYLDLNYIDDKSLVSVEMHKTFIIVTNTNYVNSSDYHNLSRSYLSFRIEKVENYSDYNVDYYYDKIQIDKVNDILSFGLFDPHVESNYTYSVAKITNRRMDNSFMGSLCYGLFVNFKNTGLVKKYTITTFSLENFLAKFGGYFQVIFVLFNFISQTINSCLLERHIKKSFKKQINKIEDILKTCQIQLADVQENANILSRSDPSEKSIKDEERLGEIETVNNVAILSKISTPFKNNFIELGSVKQHSVVKIQDLVTFNKTNKNKNKFLPLFNNFIKGKIAEQINFQNISNEKNYKIAVEDFINLFDFKRLYYIIKEIKLMKYFLFTKEQKFYINQFKKIPFQVDKLDKFEFKSENIDVGDRKYHHCKQHNTELFENRIIEIIEFFNHSHANKNK